MIPILIPILILCLSRVFLFPAGIGDGNWRGYAVVKDSESCLVLFIGSLIGYDMGMEFLSTSTFLSLFSTMVPRAYFPTSYFTHRGPGLGLARSDLLNTLLFMGLYMSKAGRGSVVAEAGSPMERYDIPTP